MYQMFVFMSVYNKDYSYGELSALSLVLCVRAGLLGEVLKEMTLFLTITLLTIL